MRECQAQMRRALQYATIHGAQNDGEWCSMPDNLAQLIGQVEGYLVAQEPWGEKGYRAAP